MKRDTVVLHRPRLDDEGGSHTWVALQAAGYDVVGVDDFSNSSPRVLERLARLLGRAPVFERADVRDEAAMTSSNTFCLRSN